MKGPEAARSKQVVSNAGVPIRIVLTIADESVHQKFETARAELGGLKPSQALLFIVNDWLRIRTEAVASI